LAWQETFFGTTFRITSSLSIMTFLVTDFKGFFLFKVPPFSSQKKKLKYSYTAGSASITMKTYTFWSEKAGAQRSRENL